MGGDGSTDAYDLDEVAATSKTPSGESPRTAGFAAAPAGVGDYLRQRWEAIKAGELGALPILMGLLVFLVSFRPPGSPRSCGVFSPSWVSSSS